MFYPFGGSILYLNLKRLCSVITELHLASSRLQHDFCCGVTILKDMMVTKQNRRQQYLAAMNIN
ncbi:hypothetical protein C0J52_14932 [Blattella germanica]|nr:hypothetical protein C0J52_14932 [Blattella germanica]